MLIRIIESLSLFIDVIMVLYFDIIYENGVMNIIISDYLFVFVWLNLKIFRFLLCYIIVCSYVNYDLVNFFIDLVFKVLEFFIIFDEFDVNIKLFIFNKVF